MRMAQNQLLASLICDIVQIKTAGFFLNVRMEDDLHEQIAKFLTQMRCALLVNRLADLISLLQKIAAQALMRLLPIPGTATLTTENLNNPTKILHIVGIFVFKIYHSILSFASQIISMIVEFSKNFTSHRIWSKRMSFFPPGISFRSSAVTARVTNMRTRYKTTATTMATPIARIVGILDAACCT